MKKVIFGLAATVVVTAMVLFACNKSQVEDVEISAMEEQTLINPAIVAAADAFGATVACESGPFMAAGVGVACSGIAAYIIDK